MLHEKTLFTSMLFMLAVSQLGGCEQEAIDEFLTHVSDAIDDADGYEGEDPEASDTGIRDTEFRDTAFRDTESRDTESRDTESRDTESRDTESRDTEDEAEPWLEFVEVGECDGSPAESETRVFDTDRPEDTEEARPDTYIVTRGDTVTLFDEDVPVNCCADLAVRVEFTKSRILVTEIEVVGEEGLCRCMCTRDVTAVIEGLSPGMHALNVQRISADGTVSDIGSFLFECVETPDEWGYRGVTCVN